jgi:hypothetical protein
MANLANALDAQENQRTGQLRWATFIAPLVPGGAERMRAVLKERAGQRYDEQFAKIGTIHEARWVIFDNDTKAIFVTSWDGDLESYLIDFQTKVPELMHTMSKELVGYPASGVQSPEWIDFLLQYYVPTIGFFSTTAEVTNRQIAKALRVNGAVEQLLDAAG